MAETGFSPPKFADDHGSSPRTWLDYKDELLNYFVAAGINDAADARKIAILKYGIGPRLRETLTTFVYVDPAKADKFADVLKALDDYFEPKKLVKLNMKKFDACCQEEGETIGAYISRLRSLANKCEFGATADNQLCKQLSSGVRSKTLRDKLWSEDLTLDKLIEKCHLHEQRQESLDVIDNKSQVNAVSRGRGRGRRYHSQRGSSHSNQSQSRQSHYNQRGSSHSQSGQSNYTQSQRGSSHSRQSQPRNYDRDRQQNRTDFRQQNRTDYRTDGNCTRCGTRHQPRQCPAYGKICAVCGRRNHFARMCRRQSSQVYVQTNDYVQNDSFNDNAYNDNVVYVNDVVPDVYDDKYVWMNGTNVSKMWSKQFEIQNCGQIMFRLDTAAESSIVSKQAFDALRQKPNVRSSKTRLIGFGNQSIYPIGVTTLPCLHNGKIFNIECEIVDGNVPNVLGLQHCTQMNLVKLVNACENQNQISWPESVTNCKHSSARDVLYEFSDVFQGLGKVPGEVSLKVCGDATPIAHPPRPVPAALREAVQSKLAELESQDIIEKIPVGEPTPWCSALHIVPKKDSSVRITIDPRDLNEALYREYHPVVTVEEVARKCGPSKYFTVLDANSGYFQLVLDKESRSYTAFNTPFGRYRYKRLPMGITSAPELFQRIFGDIFGKIPGLHMIMDDFLIASNSLEKHNEILRQTLQVARENNITFSPRKIQLCAESVVYSGHKFTKDGLALDPERVRAIVDMPEPTSIANVHTILGMITYICKYLKNLSSLTEPLRSLIKQSNEPGFQFHFDEVHREALARIKHVLTTAPVLRFYSLKDPIVISGDASQSGLGCVLMQNGAPVAYASKALTDTEFAYAQIEKEMLAIVFAVQKFHTYIYGRSDVVIETDHLPLVRIFQKPLYQIPIRLQKMRMRLQGYDFKLVAKRGKDIPVADALSRNFLKERTAEICSVDLSEMSNLHHMRDSRLVEIRENTNKDEALQSLISVIKEGWPDSRNQVVDCVKPYFNFQDELSVLDGIVFRGQRVVVPDCMRSEALSKLHNAHQGIVRTKQLARDLLYWPGLSKQIEDMIAKCASCQNHRNNQQKEPLMPRDVPKRAWAQVGVDLFDCIGHKWLICVDYFSDYFEMEKLPSTNGSAVIRQLKKWFSAHGIPLCVVSDNGPPFGGFEFKEFSRTYGFEISYISPKHSQSNGMVEKAVGIAKNMLIKCAETRSDPYLALLNLRNTQREECGSPAQRLFGRRTRTVLPTRSDLFDSPGQKKVQFRLVNDRMVRAKSYYDRNSRELPPLQPKQTIRVRNNNGFGKSGNWEPALLIGPTENPRSYHVQLESGKVTRRNRRSLLGSKETDIYRQRFADDELEQTPVQRAETRTEVIPEDRTENRNEIVNSSAEQNVPERNVTKTVTRTGRQVHIPQRFKDYVL